jgi:hypothetical protein
VWEAPDNVEVCEDITYCYGIAGGEARACYAGSILTMRRTPGRFELCVISVAAGLSACSSSVPAFAPPAQFVMPPGRDPQPEVRLLKMNGLDANFAVLEGVPGAGSGEEQKWTSDRARFQFRVASLDGDDLYLRFAVPEVTFRRTGPVRVSIDVNGRMFDSFVRTTPGQGEYRHPAEAIETRPFDPLILSIRIDPPYIAEEDNAKLGILLNEIGFVPRGGRQ